MIWCLVTVPGYYHRTTHDVWQHGWPAVHLWRVKENAYPWPVSEAAVSWPPQRKFRPDQKFWTQPSNWPIPNKADAKLWYWSAGGLAVNLSCFIAFLLIFVAMVEWRRRRRNSFWQFSIAEFLLLTAIVAWPFASTARGRSLRGVWYSLINREGCRVSCHDQWYLFADRLMDYRANSTMKVGYREHPACVRYEKVTFIPRKGGQPNVLNVGQTIRDIKSLGIRQVAFVTLDESSIDVLSRLDPKRITHLAIKNLSPGQDLSWLGRFQQLEVLELASDDLTQLQFEFPVLRSLNRLRLWDSWFEPQTVDWIKSQPQLESLTTRPFLRDAPIEQQRLVMKEFPHLWKSASKHWRPDAVQNEPAKME